MQNQHTETFLSTLYGPTWADVALRWRCIHPDRGRPPAVLHDTFAAARDELARLNDLGYGIFLQINPATGTRDRSVTSIVALFVDCDVGDVPEHAGMLPDLVVRSGNGEHAYWRVSDVPVAEFAGLQRALATAMGTDPSICNPSRIMRVPGFWWTKPGPGARDAWVMVTASAWGGGPRPAADIVGALTSPPAGGADVTWAMYRLACAITTIKAAPPKTSQDTFNRVAYEIKDYVRAGLLEENAARVELSDAAAARGVDGVAATLNSAFSAGGTSAMAGSGAATDNATAAIFPSCQEEDIARALVERWGGPERVMSAGGILYRYSDDTGTWEGYGDAHLRSVVAGFHRSLYLKPDGTMGRLQMGIGLRTKVAQALLETPSIYVASLADFRKGAPRGVAFSDGFLRVEERGVALVSHSPENRAMWRLPWSWGGSVGAPTPRWSRFLAEIFEDCDEDELDLRSAFLGAYVGSAILGVAPRWSRSILLLGKGANGKSVLLRALAMMLPGELTSCVPPTMWGDPYYRVGLKPPVVLNLVPELGEGDWMHSQWFKSIVAGDEMSAREPYGKPQTFGPVAGHMLAVNDLPGSQDRSEGFWRRMVVLPFGVSFTGREVAADALVGALAKEREGVVRWAIEWAVTSMECGELPEFEGNQEQVREWRTDNDPVALWLDDRCERVEGKDGSAAASLFADFQVWMSANGYKARTSQWWGKQLTRLEVERHRTNKAKMWGLKIR